MRVILATNHLGLGGSESYLLTVAEQFDRLGHQVVIFSPEPGAGAQVAAERGLATVQEAGLAGEFDAALVQDPAVSFEIASRFPALPQVFVAHSESFDLQAPPQLEGAVSAIVALNDRIARRLRAFGVQAEIVRLRQPIDTERFLPAGALPEVARRAILLSNASNDDRLEMLSAACAEAGLELTKAGGASGQLTDIRATLANADVVIGYGRSLLEAMACGRAAYVYERNGGDGWVTPETYPELEADGFAGRSGRVVLDRAALADGLKGYSASMGPVNHDLVIAHHRANVHAQELIELLARVAPPSSRPPAPLAEMARLVRLEWRARADLQGIASENLRLQTRLQDSLIENEAVRMRDAAQIEALRRELGETRALYERSWSWRITAPVRRLARVVRRLLRREGDPGSRGRAVPDDDRR